MSTDLRETSSLLAYSQQVRKGDEVLRMKETLFRGGSIEAATCA